MNALHVACTDDEKLHSFSFFSLFAYCLCERHRKQNNTPTRAGRSEIRRSAEATFNVNLEALDFACTEETPYNTSPPTYCPFLISRTHPQGRRFPSRSSPCAVATWRAPSWRPQPRPHTLSSSCPPPRLVPLRPPHTPPLPVALPGAMPPPRSSRTASHYPSRKATWPTSLPMPARRKRPKKS